MRTASPCTGVCAIDRGSSLCRGCGRTMDEVIAWPKATEAERAALVALLPGRHAEFSAPPRFA